MFQTEDVNANVQTSVQSAGKELEVVLNEANELFECFIRNQTDYVLGKLETKSAEHFYFATIRTFICSSLAIVSADHHAIVRTKAICLEAIAACQAKQRKRNGMLRLLIGHSSFHDWSDGKLPNVQRGSKMFKDVMRFFFFASQRKPTRNAASP